MIHKPRKQQIISLVIVSLLSSVNSIGQNDSIGFTNLKKSESILVKSSERDQILKKIKTKPWVNKFYKNPEKFLKQLPLNCNVADENEFPLFL